MENEQGEWMTGAHDVLHFMLRRDGKLTPLCGEVDPIRRNWFRRPPATQKQLHENPYCENCLRLQSQDNQR